MPNRLNPPPPSRWPRFAVVVLSDRVMRRVEFLLPQHAGCRPPPNELRWSTGGRVHSRASRLHCPLELGEHRVAVEPMAGEEARSGNQAVTLRPDDCAAQHPPDGSL